MIKPINGHVLIEPLKHETFIASQRDTFEEVGIVLAVPELFEEIALAECPKVGDKVFFDSWKASKYPKLDGENGDYFWLVEILDIRAIETKNE